MIIGAGQHLLDIKVNIRLILVYIFINLWVGVHKHEIFYFITRIS